ncbi:3'(2'),5'-bisphosphate nucleotidase CysQ [Luteimonas sp. BDR2-5]|uniref:3'(2'),5'-bisphosphate nucleotidase CysQ n=1 Tax=Proluteimonas luteida TaxID=2878685 RepID=UPI001E2B755E|nr:3'(2'),5'-bisphosphate nucleotidase CysQ [Luteimonas sp. BDR2-5]
MTERACPVDAAVREGVIAIARDAASAILAVYAHDFEVVCKADHSPVTAADLDAHRIIVAGLRRLTPGIPVLSEEAAGNVPTAERRSWTRMWLVDPLDGTREFVKRNGEFSVNIALIEDGVATFGVIQAPVTGLVWHGALARGAFRRDGDADTPIHTRRCAGAPPSALRVAASRSHRDPRTTALLARIGDVVPMPLGSSLKFCRIAEGGMDVYPRFGPTSEWDTAAGQAILEAAGGCLLDPQGRPFRYNRRDTLLNGDFIALGDPDLPWREWI